MYKFIYFSSKISLTIFSKLLNYVFYVAFCVFSYPSFSEQWIVKVDILVVLLTIASDTVLCRIKTVSTPSSSESAVEVDILVVLLTVTAKTILSWWKSVSSSSATSESKSKSSVSSTKSKPLRSRHGQADHHEHEGDSDSHPGCFSYACLEEDLNELTHIWENSLKKIIYNSRGAPKIKSFDWIYL